MGLKKGPWTPEEDHILITHIQRYGHQNWRALPKQAEDQIRMPQVAVDASNANTSNERNPPIVGLGFYSTAASNGCNEIDEEMEFWYNLFIQTGQ
ncbi:unnamed protein product [Lupinus luteus]|uniref:Uncharacterized protein n=1 Tax=Lupinus luteus TaxID=3873 RepID=A0AAV1VSS2_LUPLU